jgi:triosephosphate isomerase
MRPRIVAGNWKMNLTSAPARDLAAAIVQGAGSDRRVQAILCPPFPYLSLVRDAITGSPVALGAQNCFDRMEGAYTGEVSPRMLADVGCSHVLVGHSERRHGLGERDDWLARKVRAARDAGLTVILCVGETLEERQNGQAESVFDRQVRSTLTGLDAAALAGVILAYEPVWAIGTGHVATPEVAQRAHFHIRARLAEMGAGEMPILYGGSVTAQNAAGLFAQPDIDGGLIGGASLKADSFLAIIRAAAPTAG